MTNCIKAVSNFNYVPYTTMSPFILNVVVLPQQQQHSFDTALRIYRDVYSVRIEACITTWYQMPVQLFYIVIYWHHTVMNTWTRFLVSCFHFFCSDNRHVWSWREYGHGFKEECILVLVQCLPVATRTTSTDGQQNGWKYYRAGAIDELISANMIMSRVRAGQWEGAVERAAAGAASETGKRSVHRVCVCVCVCPTNAIDWWDLSWDQTRARMVGRSFALRHVLQRSSSDWRTDWPWLQRLTTTGIAMRERGTNRARLDFEIYINLMSLVFFN